MDEQANHPTDRGPEPALFSSKKPEKDESPVNAWAVAGLVVLVIVGAILFFTRHKAGPPPNTVQPLDPYASSLPISQLAMSESTSLSGGKSTFVDGHIRNTGGSTVRGVTVQVFFANDEQMPPRIVTLPLMLIRTHQPYIDTQPVSANPIKPGDDREFRLIFETIPGNWNQQTPQIHIIGVTRQ